MTATAQTEPRIRSIRYLASSRELIKLHAVAKAHGWHAYDVVTDRRLDKFEFCVFAPSAEIFDRAYTQAVAADMLARDAA